MELGYVTLLLLIKEHLLRISVCPKRSVAPLMPPPAPPSEEGTSVTPTLQLGSGCLCRLRHVPQVSQLVTGGDKVPAHL